MKATFPITVLENKETGNLIVTIMGHTVFLNRESHFAMYDCLYNALKATWNSVERTKIDVAGKTKGDIMNIAYKADKEQLNQVDTPIPQELADELRTKDESTFWYVYDYNDNKAFGTLTDLREKAMENGIELITK